MMKNISKLIVASVIVGLCSVKVGATPMLGQVWGTGQAVNWTTIDIGSGGATDNGLTGNSITLSVPSGFAPAATISTTGYYAGDYSPLLSTPGLAVRFTFDPNVLPDANNGGLSFYFKSGANVWYATALINSQPQVVGSQLLDFSIGSASDWSPALFNEGGAVWATAFSAIDEIGFEVHGQNGDALTYTFSNIELYNDNVKAVPEPETIWMIFMVLASLGITFRNRLTELAGQVKARIKA